MGYRDAKKKTGLKPGTPEGDLECTKLRRTKCFFEFPPSESSGAMPRTLNRLTLLAPHDGSAVRLPSVRWLHQKPNRLRLRTLEHFPRRYCKHFNVRLFQRLDSGGGLSCL